MAFVQIGILDVAGSKCHRGFRCAFLKRRKTRILVTISMQVTTHWPALVWGWIERIGDLLYYFAFIFWGIIMERSVFCAAASVLLLSGPASALTVNWIDWETGSTDDGTFTATGTITSGSETIDVTYTNVQGISFFQDGVSGNTTDYFSARGPNSPYESAGSQGVDNRPPGAEMIALRFAGEQTLTFSQTVENLYYSFVSMNGNGYEFSQDFEILSYTRADVDGEGTDSDGFWGGGLVERVDNGGTYSLNAISGNGTEPHGTILFTDTFDELTWISSSNENWNGFTIGVQGTDAQVPDGPPTDVIPLPAGIWLMLSGIGLFGMVRRRT